MPDDNLSPVQQMYKRHYGTLLEACLESRQLFVKDADRLVESLAGRLDSFPGSTDAEFLEWAAAILKPAADRLSRFYELKRDHDEIVYAAIWRSLNHATEPNRFDHYEATVEELASEIWFWVFENLDAILAPGSAKPSTRLFALAKRHTQNWVSKQRRRNSAVSRRLAGGQGFLDVEVLSEPEIRAFRASEQDEKAA